MTNIIKHVWISGKWNKLSKMLLFTLRAGAIPVPTPAQIQVSGKSCENRVMAHGPRGRCRRGPWEAAWCHKPSLTHSGKAAVTVRARRLVRGHGAWVGPAQKASQARTRQSGQAAGPADTTSARDYWQCSGRGMHSTTEPLFLQTPGLTFTFWNIPLPSQSHPYPHCLGRYL